MVVYCSVYGCMSTSRIKNRMFFSFPREETRCKQWIKATGRPNLYDKNLETLNKCYKICDLHFEESSLISRRLVCNAVPVLMLPNFNEGDPSRLSKDTQTTWDVQSVEVQTCEATAELSSSYTIECKKKNILGHEVVKLGTRITVQDESYLTPQLMCIINLNKKLHRISRGNIHSKEYKLLALSIFFAGPTAYRLLSKIMILPSEKKLRSVNLNTGTKISPKVKKFLESKVKLLTESEKYCVICADEMSLKRQLFYHINTDKIIGFREIDGEQSTEPATRALVVMARGIFLNWKQPIAYSFLARRKNYSELNTWLESVIAEMIRIGFKVVAFVSDQGANFLNFAKSKNVTVDNPYFFVDSHKIYYIYDVPHLVKSLRNNLLKYDIQYQGAEDAKTIASWRDIIAFYTQDSDRVLSLAPKLTESHINPNKFEKMKLKYATQVFSKTVAAGMKLSIESGYLNNRCTATVKVIELVNDTFDILNSAFRSDSNKYKKPFAGLSYQFGTLDNFMIFLNEAIIRDAVSQEDVTGSVKCIDGFKITLKSIMNLWVDLTSRGHEFIFTRRLNLDVLESLLGSIRQQAGKCRAPTPVQFSKAFRKKMVLNMMKHSDLNSKADMDQILAYLDDLLTCRVTESDHFVHRGISDDPTMAMIRINRIDYRFDTPEENALNNVCSYILQACHDSHNCVRMNRYMKLAKQNVNKKAKNIKVNPLVGLPNIPKHFVIFIKELEKRVVNVLNKKRFVGCLANTILEAQSSVTFTDCCPCFPTQYAKRLFVRLRIFNIVTTNNRLIKSKSYKLKYVSVPDL